DHRINGEDTGLDRTVHIAALDHARGDALDIVKRIGLDGALAVDGVTERVDDAANQAHADRHRGDTTQRANFVAFLNRAVIAHDDDTDVIRFKVEGDTGGTVTEAHQLAEANVLQTFDASNTVTDFGNVAHLDRFYCGRVSLNLSEDCLIHVGAFRHVWNPFTENRSVFP